MDPDACLEEIRAKIKQINDEQDDMAALVMLPELTELVEALDEWISKGGYLPKGWTKDGN
jgi:hypothetical protein